MSNCELHNIKFNYTCPVCEYRVNFMFLNSIYVESFDAGYNGHPYVSIYVKKAYEDGKSLRIKNKKP